MRYSLISSTFLATAAYAQFQSFLTRPDFTGVVDFQILTPVSDPSTLAPGYYFLTPYVSDFSPAAYGPMIVDYTGQLIWYGNESVQVRGQDMHVCDFNDHGIGTHICFNDAAPVAQGGHSSGSIRFFDNTYTEVGGGDYNAANGLSPPDIHELNTPDFGDGSYFIQDVYQSTPADLTAYGGPEDGYVWNGCFQQIDLNTRTVLFQWCSMDHIDLNETHAYMTETPGQYFNAISGNGTEQGPWDYAHINGIDLTPRGDFLVSLRHAHMIVKVAGPNTQSGVAPGEVIWRLGGKLGNFSIPFQFSWQHNPRSQLADATTDDLTIFDNSGDGSSQTAPSSTGKWIHVDTTTYTATLVHQYNMPEGFISSSQGSLQPLSNGNVLAGWGSLPYFTEFTRDGTILQHTHFGLANNDNLQNYRAWKYTWTGRPTEAPVVLPYAQNCSGELYAYVSWNGATDVASYRFHKGFEPCDGTDTQTTVQNRTGFETRADLGTFAQCVFVEALDADGNVMGTSATNTTFVPNDASAAQCGEMACDPGFVYDGASAADCGNDMDLGRIFDIPNGPLPVFDTPKQFQGVDGPPDF